VLLLLASGFWWRSKVRRVTWYGRKMTSPVGCDFPAANVMGVNPRGPVLG
jgi:hypothetical protein